MKRVRYATLPMALAGAAVLTGCGPDPVKSLTEAPPGTAAAQQPFVPKADAGVRREPGDSKTLVVQASKQTFNVRSDPFAMSGRDVAYDRSQFAAAMTASMGWYPNIADERVEVQETFEYEPQPPRRLAGILVGETISALIDMGDGTGLQTIRPGQEIKSGDTTWIVQSIDEEKAILRRATGNKRPKYVVVRLEDSGTMSAPAGGSQGGNTGGAQGGGNRATGGGGGGGARDIE